MTTPRLLYAFLVAISVVFVMWCLRQTERGSE